MLAWEFLDNPRPAVGASAVVFGVLAALVKITTFLLFLEAFFLLYTIRSLGDLYARWPVLGRIGYHATVILLLMAIPIVATHFWTSFSDAQKEQSMFGGKNLTSASLMRWNFGTLADRLDIQKWRQLESQGHKGINFKAAAACVGAMALASLGWLGFCAVARMLHGYPWGSDCAGWQS